MIQQRVVLPREAAEQRWRDTAVEREERLWAWTSYFTHLVLQPGGTAGSASLLRADMPRALNELDSGRRARLLSFLREVRLGDAITGDSSGMATRTAGGEPAQRLPSRGLVRAVAVFLSMSSAFLVLWMGLSAIGILTTDAAHKAMQETLGIKIDKTQLLGPACSGCIDRLCDLKGSSRRGASPLYRTGPFKERSNLSAPHRRSPGQRP
jgi:hypothetical protein